MWKSVLIALAILATFIIVRYFYMKPNYSAGEQAPNIEMSIDGKTIGLEDLRGNYVLVDFWGSWCPPCLKENPELVKLYDEFNEQKFIGDGNFEIVSIGIESSERTWRKAIQKFGLRWPYHYSDFQRFKSPIAQEYGVREIPSKFLVNPEGHIVLVNSPVEEIRKFLQSKLK